MRYRPAMFEEYRIPHDRWSLYTVDHLVPIELNGRVRYHCGHKWRNVEFPNVWPKPKIEAKQKDAVKDALDRAVCSRRGCHRIHLTMQEADDPSSSNS